MSTLPVILVFLLMLRISSWTKLSCSWFFETYMADSIRSSNFSLIQKDSVTCMVFLFFWNRDFLLHIFLVREFSNKNYEDSYICFWLAYFHSVCYVFFIYPTHSLLFVITSFSSNIDQVHCWCTFLSILDVHHKDWLTYSGGTNTPCELCYNFYTQMTFFRILNFFLWSLTVIPTVLLFWICFCLLSLIFVLQWLSLY